MRRQELVPGQRYIVSGFGVGTYAGVHDGVLTAADGTEFHGGKGSLRFVFEGESTPLVKLIGDGRDIKEPEATKLAREEMQRERAEARTQALKQAYEFMDSIGIYVMPHDLGFKEQRAWRDEHDSDVEFANASETVEGLAIRGLTVGDLMKVTGYVFDIDEDETPELES